MNSDHSEHCDEIEAQLVTYQSLPGFCKGHDPVNEENRNRVSNKNRSGVKEYMQFDKIYFNVDRI